MRKKYLGLICLLYAGIILFVNHYNILRNFLAPSMQIYLKCAVPLLIFMAIIIFYSDKFHYHFKVSDLVLILPLVMLIAAGDGRLSTSLSTNKVSNIKTTKKVEKKLTKKNNDPKIDVSKLDFSNPYFNVEDDIYLDLGNYLTYNSNAEKFIGKTIKVRGFTVGNSDYLPDGLYGLGKYGVSCCIADAAYMGFIIKPGNHKIKGSTWYEVEGYIERSQDLSGHDIFPITVVNIKEIDGKDEEEYIYSCYEYGDGSCQKLKKYDLKY